MRGCGQIRRERAGAHRDGCSSHCRNWMSRFESSESEVRSRTRWRGVFHRTVHQAVGASVTPDLDGFQKRLTRAKEAIEESSLRSEERRVGKEWRCSRAPM